VVVPQPLTAAGPERCGNGQEAGRHLAGRCRDRAWRAAWVLRKPGCHRRGDPGGAPGRAG